MSNKKHERWIIFYGGDTINTTDCGFRYIKYIHLNKVFVWTNKLNEAHRFYSSHKAGTIAKQKGGRCDIAPECRYG